MGRGRAKAKQTKVARQLKYSSGGTDLERLQAELAAERGGEPSSVTSDGTNFYADASASAGTTISTFAPSGSTYTRTDYTVSRSDLNALKYGDGYLLSIANTNGAGNLIIYKLVGGAPVEIPTADYFQRYYISNPDSHYVTPSFHSFYDSTIMKSGTKVYLITEAVGDDGNRTSTCLLLPDEY